MDSENRSPLVDYDDVLSAFGVALARAGKTHDETRDWAPIVLQTRISRTGDRGSTSPERQIANQAEWCVEHHFHPCHLVHEEVSGSIYRKRHRRRFEQFSSDVSNDRLRDPLTGNLIGDIACFHYDRFTRDPEEGGDWLRLLRSKGMRLHETYYRAAPKPLHEVEHEMRDAWNRGSKEVMRLREREMDECLRKARLGIPSYNTERMFGHRREVDPRTGRTAGYSIVPEEAAVIREVVDQVVARNGNLYSVTRFLNDNGYRNVAGGKWRYSNVMRLLRAPRLAGLVQLRVDPTRLHDRNYKGELFPAELIYEDGDTPPSTFTPPIEPIIPYPTWARLQATLDGRKRNHSPARRYFASNYVECGTCGGSIVAGRTIGGAAQYRCPKHHLSGVSRKGHRHCLAAADGVRHPTLRVEQLDYVLSEVIFAAVDREPDRALAEEDDTTEAEKEVERRALATLDERLGNISYMLQRQAISRAQYDEWLAEIEEERTDHRRRLAELNERRIDLELPEGVTLRDLWPELSVDERRQWIPVVFKRVVLNPASNLGAQNIATRFEFTFRDGYEPPTDELQTLLLSIEDDIRLKTEHGRVPEFVYDRIVELAREGYRLSEIGRTLTAEGVVGPRGGTRWTDGRVAYMLKKACRTRGIPYPKPRDRGRTPRETRLLVVALAKKTASYEATARELNRLAVPRPNGAPWTGHGVRDVLKHHEYETGEARPLSPVSVNRGGRQRHLPAAIRDRLWEMHRTEGQPLRQIAEWLKKSGIKTASGKTNWSAGTILYVIRGVEIERAEMGSA